MEEKMKMSKIKTAGILSLVLWSTMGLAETAVVKTTRSVKVDGKKVGAENTANNIVDRNDRTVTPEDQARGMEADVEVTRKIRETLTADTNLSMNAKNIKIITLKGVVTLRGPVNSKEEIAKIENVAQQVAGPQRRVHSELKISL